MMAPIRTETLFEKINNLLQFHTYLIIGIGDLQIRDLFTSLKHNFLGTSSTCGNFIIPIHFLIF